MNYSRLRKLAIVLWLVGAATSAYGACSATVNTPATLTGFVTFSTTTTTCPSGATVDYILNDLYRIARVRNTSANPTFSYRWNSSFSLDGPQQIKAVVYDATGTSIATSAEVPVTAFNFGATCTVNTVSSASGNVTGTYQATPTVSGTLTIDYSCTGFTFAQVEFAMDGIPWNTGFSPPNQPTGAHAATFDTTQLVNGVHRVSSVVIRSTSPNPLSTAQIQFSVNVSNTASTVIGVKPDIQSIVLTTGGVNSNCTVATVAAGGCNSYVLTPQVQKADGSLGSGSFTYSFNGACNVADPQAPAVLDFLCTSGNTRPATSANSNWISLSAASGASTTITALARGHAIITITETGSGKVAWVHVAVKSYTAPPHFTLPGAIVNAPKNDGTDIFRISSFALDAGAINGTGGVTTPNDGNWPAAVKAAAINTIEQDWGILATTTYANQSAWESAFTASSAYNNIVGANTKLGSGFCFAERGDSDYYDGGDLGDTVGGPSAAWTTPPMPDGIKLLQAAGINVCEMEAKDEEDAVFGVNPVFDFAKSNGTLDHIVVSGCPGACIATYFTGPGSGGQTPEYGGSTNNVGQTFVVQGGSTTGLNGSYTTTRAWCGSFDLWINGKCGGPNGGNPGPLNSFDGHTGITTNGTYPLTGGDAGTNILAYAFGVFAGDAPFPNNAFTTAHNQLASVGTADCYPIRAIAATLSYMYYSRIGPCTITYTSHGSPPNYEDTYTQFFWGASNREIYASENGPVWGQIVPFNGGGVPKWYWQTNGVGYVSINQDVPHLILEQLDSWNYNVGGQSAVPTMTNSAAAGGVGACMTSSPLDGIQYPTNAPFPYTHLLFSGTGDALSTTHSGQWYAGPPCNNGQGHLIYRSKHASSNPGPSDTPGCIITAQGTANILGVNYTISAGSGSGGNDSGIFTSPNLPTTNLIQYGTPVTISGAVAGCNGTWAFFNYFANNGFNFTSYANSSISATGTVLINDNKGFVDPRYDQLVFNNKPESIQLHEALWAGDGGAGVRAYDSNPQGVQSDQSKGNFANANNGAQLTADGFANSNIDIQRRWRAWAQINAFLNRVAAWNFGDFLPAPFIGNVTFDNTNVGPDVACSAHNNSALGIILLCANTLESPVTLTIPHSRYQNGTNPVSIYHVGFPEEWTDLRTGALTTESFTWQPGEIVAFVYHNGATSYVQNNPFVFTLPSGATQACVKYSYMYADPLPLAESVKSFCGATSPLALNLDTKMGNIFLQPYYLNASNVQVGGLPTAVTIPQH